MSITINVESIVNSHLSSLDLIEGDLKDSSLKLVDTDEFSKLLGQKIQKNLAEAGKSILDSRFNNVLTLIQEQASEDFKKIYANRLTAVNSLLVQNNNSAEIIEDAQAQLVEELKKNNKVLLEKLTTELRTKGQNIVIKDNTQLDTIFEHYKEQINDKLKDTLEFFGVFGKEFKERLSEAGKAIFGIGLNTDALTTLQDQLKKDFNTDYQEVIDLSKDELQRSNEPEITVRNAQARLAQKLKKTKAELLPKLTAKLSTKGQIFNTEDQVQLNTAFKQYMDKTAEKLNESLNQFKSLDSVKLRLQTHNLINSTFKKKAAFRAAGLNNTSSLSDVPKPHAPTAGFTVNSNNLYQQLRYTIAKKPGEQINIDLSIPNREENQRQLAEAGLQHRIPGLALLVSLLLWLIVHLRLYLKNDEQRISDVINKLIKEDSLSIDPKDIKLKISQVAQNGKGHVIQEGALSELTLQKLNQSRQEIKKILQDGISNHQKNRTPTLTPSSGYNSAEENDDEESKQRPTYAP